MIHGPGLVAFFFHCIFIFVLGGSYRHRPGQQSQIIN